MARMAVALLIVSILAWSCGKDQDSSALKAAQAREYAPPPGLPAELEATAELYVTATCATCHGDSGAGTALSNRKGFDDPDLKAKSDAEIRDILKHGVSGTTMAGGLIADDQLDAMVAYVRWLGEQSANE